MTRYCVLKNSFFSKITIRKLRWLDLYLRFHETRTWIYVNFILKHNIQTLLSKPLSSIGKIDDSTAGIASQFDIFNLKFLHWIRISDEGTIQMRFLKAQNRLFDDLMKNYKKQLAPVYTKGIEFHGVDVNGCLVVRFGATSLPVPSFTR